MPIQISEGDKMAYLAEPQFYALATGCLHEALRWERESREISSRDKRAAEQELMNTFVCLLGQFDSGLREENLRLTEEVLRLKRLRIKPMQIGDSSMINGHP